MFAFLDFGRWDRFNDIIVEMWKQCLFDEINFATTIMTYDVQKYFIHKNDKTKISRVSREKKNTNLSVIIFC